MNNSRHNVEGNLLERAYGRLKEMIITGDISEENPRTERELSHIFGMSRTPIKHALSRLQHEGLITIVPRQGIFPVKESYLEYQHILAVREVLEGLAARLAVQYISIAKTRYLRNVFDCLGDIYDTDKVSHEQYATANVTFHREILRLSHNPKLIETMHRLYDHLNLIRLRTIEVTKRRKRSIEEHEAVIQALEDRNPARAEELMRVHLKTLRKDIEAKVKEDQSLFQLKQFTYGGNNE